MHVARSSVARGVKNIVNVYHEIIHAPAVVFADREL